MYIGSLIKNNKDFRYTYKRRGTTFFPPNLENEVEETDLYDNKGKLVADYVGYDGSSILESFIDIICDLGTACFVDSICFNQKDGSEIDKIQIFTDYDAGFCPVGIFESETNGSVKKKSITVEVGETLHKFVIRIFVSGHNNHIHIGKLQILGAYDVQNSVFPEPRCMKLGNGFLKQPICVKDGGQAKVAVENFIEKYNDRFRHKATCADTANVVFSVSDMEEEAFNIRVTNEMAVVVGGSERALLYASEKLLQLCTEDGIKQAEIFDKPFMEIRGVHFALPSREQIPFMKRLVKYLLMPMGYNQIFLQVSGVMEYKKHPEINKAWEKACMNYKNGNAPMPPHYGFLGSETLKQEEVAELCAYFRKYGFEIIPEVQSFGHTQYITLAYPETGEYEIGDIHNHTDLFYDDERPDVEYCHCMCPNHPQYYPILFDIIDEVVDVIKPEKYLHIGHDEISTIGKCERCKNTAPEEIYANEVCALYNYLKRKGLKTMLWSDMLEETTRYETAKAIDRIPKDIICLSFTWYFHLDEKINIEERLEKHGFQFLMGNMYSSFYPRFSTRRNNKKLLGAEVSTWVPCSDLYYGYEGKIFDFIYSSNMMWNQSYTEKQRITYTMLAQKQCSRIREYLRTGKLESFERSDIETDGSYKEVPYDLLNDIDTAIRVRSGESREIKVEKRCDRLVFVHATSLSEDRIPWTAPKLIGKYVIKYSDHTEAVQEILYGANICEYARRYGKPLSSPIFRHQGYLATYYCEPKIGKNTKGQPYAFYELTWVNPNADKKIASVTVLAESNIGCDIIVAGLQCETLIKNSEI